MWTPSPLQRRAMHALNLRHRSLLPDGQRATLDAGTVRDLRDNLLPHLTGDDERWIRDAFTQGDGNELAPRDGRQPRAHAAHSSATLAANTFAPFRERVGDLAISGLLGFDAVRLEAKHHPLPERYEEGGAQKSVRNRRAANLDAELTGPGLVVGVESKLTEHLTATAAKPLSPHYLRPETLDALPEPWRDAIRRREHGSATPTFLGAGQLLKHALALERAGLDGTFGTAPVNLHLLYLYWEPSDADQIDDVLQHRDEVDAFAAEVAGAGPTFHALSHRQLWRAWREDQDAPAWVTRHGEALVTRYGVGIDA